MEKVQITLVSPPGYLHSEAYWEIDEILQFGSRSLRRIAQAQRPFHGVVAMSCARQLTHVNACAASDGGASD